MKLDNRFRGFTFSEELPGESLPWQTVTELVDDRRLLIENHRGITAYSSEKILIKLHCGQLCVIGCDLCIACMTKQRLIIKGTISSISVLRGR